MHVIYKEISKTDGFIISARIEAEYNENKVMMDTRVLISTKELLDLARARVEFPNQPILVSYDEETDSLFLKFSEKKSVISQTSKKDDGVCFDLDFQNHIASIEIFDLCNN